MTLMRASLIPNFKLIVATVAVVAGCTDGLETSSVTSPGMLNGMLNGLHHTEGLTAFLAAECPLLQARLLQTGGLEQPFPAAFAAEIENPECERFMFYTAQLMLPFGETLTLTAGSEPVASFAGAMGLQHLVSQAYPEYAFSKHAFSPAYPIARKVVTQGYAALTNGITRRVSYKTNVPDLDAHRALAEDAWPRELLQLVPFTPNGIAAMANNPAFLARLPDFFNPCDPRLTNYDYLTAGTAEYGQLALPEGYCPVPVVVHGNLDFVDDVVPGRSCRIRQPGETVSPGATVNGDVIIPQGGCPLIYYTGRDPNQVIYDDRTHNPAGSDEGCDVAGPSTLTRCKFDVVAGGAPIPADFIDYYVFNVEPLAQP